MIKISWSWEWHEIFNKILHNKLFSILPFNTTNEMSRNSISVIPWIVGNALHVKVLLISDSVVYIQYKNVVTARYMMNDELLNGVGVIQ